MLWTASLAALAAQAPVPDDAVAPDRRARATVRIVSAARVEFASGSSIGEQPATVREAELREPDGTSRTALLVEFP